MTYSFPNFEPIRCFVYGSNYCFLDLLAVSQEAGIVIWYFHHFQNFPRFVVINTIKDFIVANEAEVDFFLKFLCFSLIQKMLTIWSLVQLPFLNPACTSGSSQFTYCWSPPWRILSITLLAHEICSTVR